MTKMKERREALSLTQARAAMLAGITERTWNRHEKAKAGKCPYPAQESIARVLGVKVEAIFKEGRVR